MSISWSRGRAGRNENCSVTTKAGMPRSAIRAPFSGGLRSRGNVIWTFALERRERIDKSDKSTAIRTALAGASPLYISNVQRNCKSGQVQKVSGMKRGGSDWRCRFDEIVKINEHVAASRRHRALLFLSRTARFARLIFGTRCCVKRYGTSAVASMTPRPLIDFLIDGINTTSFCNMRRATCDMRDSMPTYTRTHMRARARVRANTAKRRMCIVTANVNSTQHSGTHRRQLRRHNAFPATKYPLPAEYLQTARVASLRNAKYG